MTRDPNVLAIVELCADGRPSIEIVTECEWAYLGEQLRLLAESIVNGEGNFIRMDVGNDIGDLT